MKRMITTTQLGFCGLLFLLSSAAMAGEVHVAVAAGFKPAMEPIAKAFEASSGNKLIISYGAVGQLYAQITQGAPFDLLLSADTKIPERLEQEGIGVKGSRFTYATSQLVLWSAKPDLVDSKGEVLKRGGFSHLALPAPKVAVHGAAAVALMKKLGVWQRVEPKVVEGDNILQAMQFIETGSAELGFVSRSLIYHAGHYRPGSYWLVPASLQPPLAQQAILLDKAKDPQAAKAFMLYLKGNEATRIMKESGYLL